MTLVEKNVIIIGDTFCGKSFLVWKYINHKVYYVPTTGLEKYNREIVVDGHRFRLNLFDTGFMDSDTCHKLAFNYLLKENFFNADTILLCFDISNFETLQSVQDFWMRIINEQRKKRELPYILVGLKKDLRNNADTNKMNVPVTAEEGQKMADKIQASGYVECSATNNDGVQEVFETAVRLFLKANEKPPGGINGFLKKLFGK